MTILSKNLKRFRQEKHMTQETAAEALGVSTQTVSRWECDDTLPAADILPQIARLYCTTIDDLFRENAVAYGNFAQRLGCVYEATRDPADFLRADQEYKKLLRTDRASADDLRMYAILHQYMMQYCMSKAAELFEKGLKKADDNALYWCIQRQKISYLGDIGRGQEAVAEFLPLAEGNSNDFQVWICLIHAYCTLRDSENALLWAEKAEKKFPENAMLHVYIGDISRGLKQYDRAFAHWKRAQQLEPAWMDSAYSMADCYEELGDYENAYAAWQAIADDLSARGYDVEANKPRMNAARCRTKQTKTKV